MTIVEVNETLFLEKPTVVCLGFFDGVHLGHQALVARACQLANENRLTVCAHTFRDMPVRVLRPEADILELTPLPQKAALLGAIGVEIVAVSPFNDEMMRMRAEVFFQSILLARLRAEHIVIGFDHRFGFRAEGGAEMLRDLCEKAGVGLTVVPPILHADGALVSSSAIRSHLRSGERAAAEALLGRPYQSGNNILREG